MLSIGKLSRGQERYYLDHVDERVDAATSVGSGAEDYYADPAEARGRWLGDGSARLGLRGEVGAGELRRLLAGEHPATGEVLRVSNGKQRVAAFDLTLSAPKSVSVLYGLGDAEVEGHARAAHDAAVREAIGYLERTAAAVRRGHGGLTVEPAEGLVAAAFRHRTSRAADPQLHTHVVVANLGRGPDGRWSALDGRRLYVEARTASFIYQHVLRGELSARLGVEWEPVRQGIAEVVGVPREVLDEFSRRRQEIEVALRERGVSGPRAAEAAALATRRRKDRQVEVAELQGEWRRRAAALGWHGRELLEACGRYEREPLTSERWRQLVTELTGPEGLTRDHATFGRGDVVQALCERLPPGVARDGGRLEELADHLLRCPGVVPVLGEAGERPVARGFRRRGGRPIPLARAEHAFTTAELLATEAALVSAVEAHRTDGAGLASQDRVAAAIERRPTVSDEQVSMIRRLTQDGEGVAVVAGKAGTGKTFALAAAREAWEGSGHMVIGAAVARRAARELELGAGIPSTSVHALLQRVRAGQQLQPQTVVVVDEAGMLGTRQMAELTNRVLEARGKLILVGDHRQLPELRAGGAFRALVAREEVIELNENRRQAAAWERRAVDHLRAGRAEQALELYEREGKLVLADELDEARSRIVEDWWTSGDLDGALMIAPRRDDVAELNRQARERMRRAGRLTGEELIIGGGRFAAGDRIVIRRNELSLNVHNGDLARVVAINASLMSIDVELRPEGRRVTLDSRFLLRRSERGEPSIAHGYAVTGHVAQGATVTRTFVLAGRGVSQEWAYAAMTRGREENRLYGSVGETDRAEYAPRQAREVTRDRRAALVASLSRSRAESLAIEEIARERTLGLPDR